MADLEREIGELGGAVKALIPALNKLEERQHDASRQAASADVRTEALRKEFDQVRERHAKHISDLFERTQDCVKERELHNSQIDSLRRDVRAVVKAEAESAVKGASASVDRVSNRLRDVEDYVDAKRKAEAGFAKKAWDVVKIILAALVGAGASRLFS